MGFREALDHGKSEAGALGHRDHIVPAAAEALEDGCLILRGNANAGVFHSECRPAIGLDVRKNSYVPAGRGELDRVR
jgi:hypothetical protein